MVTHYGGGVEKRLFSASLFASIAQIIVITFGGLIILNSLCIAITPPITALGVGGLAIARANSVASEFFLRPEGLEPPSSSLEDSCLIPLDHGRERLVGATGFEPAGLPVPNRTL